VKRAPRETLDQSLHIAELVKEEYAKKKVSVTMLNNFFDCPWKWYFRNLLQLPEPLTESLHVGNVVHETIEYVLKGGHAAEAELMRVALIESRGDDVYANRLVHQARPIIESWQKKYAGELSQPFTVEQNFSYRDPDIAHLTITGKIDVVEEIISGEVRVTDWKTGSAKTKSEIDKKDDEGRMSAYLRQLAMYSYLIDGSTNANTTVSESRLVFLEAKDGDKNAIQLRKITNEEIRKLKQDIVDYDTFIQDGSWMNRKCCAKTYGAGDTCEYCALAEKFGVLRK
jgi:CRISPR/Cas system-associated exonuclease Cas4 (RecB family)